MNFIRFESAQKLRGGFYTDQDIAGFLARWVLDIKPERILEPSCGDGAFFEALSQLNSPSLKYLFGCELNQKEAAKAKRRWSPSKQICREVYEGDFLAWFLRNEGNISFDAALGNP